MAWRQAGTSFGTPPPVGLRDAGSSTSGVAAIVAQIVAAAGQKLIGWTVITDQANATNTATQLTITYSDNTTTIVTTAAATGQNIRGNAGGIIIDAAATGYVSITPCAAKDVTQITVATFGTGIGVRAAAISAVGVPL